MRLLTEPAQVVLARYRNPVHLLNSHEADRAARFRRDEDRRDFIAAHVAAREVVASWCGVAVSEVRLSQRCAGCGAVTHGAPSVVAPGVEQEAHVSWSHSGGYVAAVAGSRPIGIDLEPAHRRMPADSVLAAVLSTRERDLVRAARDPQHAFYRLWTAKEALVKVGLAAIGELRQIDLGEDPSRWLDIRIRTWESSGTVISLAVTSPLAPQTGNR